MVTQPHEFPKEVSNWYIHFTSMVACFAAIIIGYDTGFIGGAVVLPEFVKEFSYDILPASKVSMDKANIISLFHVGAFFGSFAVYPLGVFYGRVWGLRISAVFILVGSAIQLIPNKARGIGALLAGRTICGFGIGAISNLATMYTSECAPTPIRGRLGAMYEIAWQIGGIIGFFINYGVNQHVTGAAQWLVPFAVQLIPAGLFFIGVFFIPESPRWYLLQNQPEKALKSLCQLRKLPADNEFIAWEILRLQEEVDESKALHSNDFIGPIKILFGSKKLIKRLVMTSSMFVFQNTTGINAINYYSVKFFESIGVTGTTSGLLSTGIFGLVKGVSCFVYAFVIVDRLGRKMPTLASLLCIFALFYIGAYIKIAKPDQTGGVTDGAGRFALGCFYIWTVGYAIAWSALPWIYMSEVFDSKVRNAAQCFNASSNWFWAFIFARFGSDMIQTMKYGVFLFFGCTCLIALVIYTVFYPETRGVPISDIDLLFEKGVRPYKARQYALEVITVRNAMASEFDKASADIQVVSEK